MTMGIVGHIRKLLLGISLEEASFERRRFPEWQPALREHLERRAKSYLWGTNLALEEPRPDKLSLLLHVLDPELRGFAFEGAAMGLTLLDLLTPWGRGRRLRGFITTSGRPHTYMFYVGAGMAYAAMRRDPRAFIRSDTGMSRWLVFNGMGFYHAFFARRPGAEVVRLPRRLEPFEAREFDGGVGRALWFIFSGDPARIAAWIERCEVSRRSHVWTGVGLASAYAGGVEGTVIDALLELAGDHRPAVAVGMALATDTRFLAGNPTPHLDVVIQRAWGRDAAELYRELEGLRARLPVDAQGLVGGGPGMETLLNWIAEAAREVESARVDRRQRAAV
jgi:enediyne biosynthesis protein E3